jgi:hypothetical protein
MSDHRRSKPPSPRASLSLPLFWLRQTCCRPSTYMLAADWLVGRACHCWQPTIVTSRYAEKNMNYQYAILNMLDVRHQLLLLPTNELYKAPATRPLLSPASR